MKTRPSAEGISSLDFESRYTEERVQTTLLSTTPDLLFESKYWKLGHREDGVMS